MQAAEQGQVLRMEDFLDRLEEQDDDPWAQIYHQDDVGPHSQWNLSPGRGGWDLEPDGVAWGWAGGAHEAAEQAGLGWGHHHKTGWGEPKLQKLHVASIGHSSASDKLEEGSPMPIRRYSSFVERIAQQEAADEARRRRMHNFFAVGCSSQLCKTTH